MNCIVGHLAVLSLRDLDKVPRLTSLQHLLLGFQKGYKLLEQADYNIFLNIKKYNIKENISEMPPSFKVYYSLTIFLI